VLIRAFFVVRLLWLMGETAKKLNGHRPSVPAGNYRTTPEIHMMMTS
jgi:hypothetical protein